jgi:hypothetical protein
VTRAELKRIIWEGAKVPTRRPSGHRASVYFCGRMRHQKEVAEMIGMAQQTFQDKLARGMSLKRILRGIKCQSC